MATTDTAPLASPAPVVGSPASGPGLPQRRSRPLNQYWDVMTATWRTVAVIPAPRQGD
jgi:hypothetical protein